MDPEIFTGNALNAVDAKGRLSIPTFIRAKRDRGPEPRTVSIGVHETAPCLTVFGPPFLEYMLGELEGRERLGGGHGRAGRDLDEASAGVFGMTEGLPYDSSGRILLPPMLRDEGQIGDLALFVGWGRYVQLWNPQLALEHGGERVRRIANYSLGQRGAK